MDKMVPAPSDQPAVVTDLNKVEYVHLSISEEHVFAGARDDRTHKIAVGLGFGCCGAFLASLVMAVVLGHPLLWILVLVTPFTLLLAGHRYESSGRFMPPKARAEFRARRGEFKRLRRRVDQHNNAFRVQQHNQEMLTGGDPEKQAALCAYWESRRAVLRGEVDAFIGDIKGIAWQELSGRQRPPSLRARRRAFRKDVRTLLEMERNLAAFSPEGYQGTQDLTPYVAVAAKRAELEELRGELGLPAKALPPSRMTKTPMLPARGSAARP